MSFSVGGQLEKCVFWLPYGVMIIQTAPRGRTRMAVVRATFYIDLKQAVETYSKLAFKILSVVCNVFNNFSFVTQVYSLTE